MIIDEMLSKLNEEQLEAVKHEGSPLLILAGAGSGKTRVITTKIAYLISEKKVKPYDILVVTFTKKAAKEMMERVQSLEPEAIHSQIRTFHSFGSWFLRMHTEEAGIDKNFTVYDDDDMVTLLTKAVPSLSRQQASLVAHKISMAKDYCYEPDSPELSSIDNTPEFPSFYKAYDRRLRETGNVDFGDLIMLPYKILRDNEQIRAHMHYRFKVVMVDEYQDSNVAQFLLLQQLVGKSTYVCVVGDDDQSIYKFRGAEVQTILSFEEHFPGTKIIKLEKNYRSTDPILGVANDVIKNNTERLGKSLISVKGEGKKPVVVFLPTQDDEISFCAELIKKTHKKGVPYSDWAILYRTNAQSMGFETAFLHKKIPYSVVGSLKFYEREEIKDIVCFMSFLANPKDEISFRRIINKPARGIGQVTQEKIIDNYRNQINESLIRDYSIIDSCADIQKSLSKKAKEGIEKFVELMTSLKKELGDEVSESNTDPVLDLAEKAIEKKVSKKKTDKETLLSSFVEKMIIESGLQEYYQAQDEIAETQKTLNLQELVNSASLYPKTQAGLIEFLDHVELDRTVETDDEETDVVTLITLHNTKGLEFPRVVITGLEHGIFPRQDKTDEEFEEERRLFYVGITRAKDELYITSCKQRRMYGSTNTMEISPFLLEVDQSQIVVLGSPPYVFSKRAVKNNDSDDIKATSGVVKDALHDRYKIGTKVYSDDYGYGYIFDTDDCDDEFVVTVQFENMTTKKFMPKYQSNRIMIIKD